MSTGHKRCGAVAILLLLAASLYFTNRALTAILPASAAAAILFNMVREFFT